MASKIGLFGGSFDPIHQGHLVVARYVFNALGLDRLVWIPAGCPWQKKGAHVDANHRSRMVALAIADDPPWALDDQELLREGPSYTVDTLRDWQAQCPDDERWFIMGDDAWARLPTWHCWREVLSLASFAVVSRQGIFPRSDCAHSSLANVRFLSMPEYPASSTQIRQALFQSDAVSLALVDAWLPVVVRRYIEEQGLYQTSI